MIIVSYRSGKKSFLFKQKYLSFLRQEIFSKFYKIIRLQRLQFLSLQFYKITYRYVDPESLNIQTGTQALSLTYSQGYK